MPSGYSHSMSNTIPTPIVDKNGRNTTVYRKPETTSTSSASMPAPVLQSKRPPRHLIIDEIMESLRSNLAPNHNSRYRESFINISRSLSGTADEEYPARVLEMVSKVAPKIDPDTVSMMELMMRLSKGDEYVVDSMCAHSDFLASHPQTIRTFTNLRRSLMEKLDVIPDDNGYMPTIESHVEAARAYRVMVRKNGWEDREDFLSDYVDNVDVMRVVEKYPSQFNELVDFIGSGNDLNEQDFQTYLSFGAVRDGML
jgi:hypothetical protein